MNYPLVSLRAPWWHAFLRFSTSTRIAIAVISLSLAVNVLFLAYLAAKRVYATIVSLVNGVVRRAERLGIGRPAIPSPQLVDTHGGSGME